MISDFERHYISSATSMSARAHAMALNDYHGHKSDANLHPHEKGKLGKQHKEEFESRYKNISRNTTAEQLAHSAKHYEANMPKNTVLYRGVRPGEVSKLKEGHSYHMRPLLSTASNAKGKITAHQFADGKDTLPIHMRIKPDNPYRHHIIEFHGVEGKHTYTGHHASTSHFGNEHEVVLAGNSTKWKVHKIIDDKTKAQSGYKYVPHHVVTDKHGEPAIGKRATKKEVATYEAKAFKLEEEHKAATAEHESKYEAKLSGRKSISPEERTAHYDDHARIDAHYARLKNEHYNTMTGKSVPTFRKVITRRYIVHPEGKLAEHIPSIAKSIGKAAVKVAKA